MKTASNQMIINAVKVYQANPFFHPLTCGKDSKHRSLEPFEDNGVVKLKCLDCDYIQDWVPECVIEMAGIKIQQVITTPNGCN